MRKNAIIPFVPYILVSVLHVVLQVFELPGRGYETKQLLMPALALAAVWSVWRLRPWPRAAMVLVLLALTTSWIGDGAGLFFPEWPTLPTMILFFGIAHLAYIVLFWRAPNALGVRRVPLWALIYVVWWVGALAIVGPHAGDLFVPLAVYGLVLGGTAALSTRFGPVAAWGGAFFLVSDTIIAFREFMDVPSWLSKFVMPTYEIGQGLIIFATVTLLHAASARQSGDAGEGAFAEHVVDRSSVA
ncbi:MAG: lysoplasmalogenase [Microbacteriaceae bacterium]|nr:lysoplasmalogenase [Microbacteriaceae bacterium]